MIIVDKKKPRKPCYLLGLGALLLAGTVSADTCSKNLMPPFTAAQAVELCATFLGTATLSSTITPGSNAAYDLGTSAAAMRSIYYATSILLNDNAGLIGSTTADAADNATLNISSTSGAAQSRGGFISVYGNEVASNGGKVVIQAGDDSDADIDLYLENASSNFTLQDSTSGSIFTITNAGVMTQAKAADFNFGVGLGTIGFQEATAGTACSGTLTANGATPVVTSTTCATTGSRIFLSRTSAETGTVNAWVSAISNGVSFSITSEAADTGTYNWVIFHEAP